MIAAEAHEYINVFRIESPNRCLSVVFVVVCLFVFLYNFFIFIVIKWELPARTVFQDLPSAYCSHEPSPYQITADKGSEEYHKKKNK